MAQNRDQLEEQRMNLIKQIENTSAAITKNKKNRSRAMEQINLLEDQISNRKELIGNINNSISSVESNITDNQAMIDTLSSNLISLRSNYESLAQIQLRKKFTDNPLILLLSAHSWSDAIKRWKLFKQFEFYFEKQSQELQELSGDIKLHITELESDLVTKNTLLESESQQAKSLDKERKEKDEILSGLTESEIKLQRSLKKQKSEREQLNKAIEDFIIKELNSKKGVNVTAEKKEAIKSESLSFSKSKGKLPWPSSGKVVAWFGKHDHPDIKNVVVENNGVDIKISGDASVRPVYSGKVITISFIPGHHNMIIIQHGNYFSVYSKLSSVNVTVGQIVSPNDIIGKVHQPNNQDAILHFEVWNGKQKENPANWIK